MPEEQPIINRSRFSFADAQRLARLEWRAGRASLISSQVSADPSKLNQVLELTSAEALDEIFNATTEVFAKVVTFLPSSWFATPPAEPVDYTNPATYHNLVNDRVVELRRLIQSPSVPN